MRVSLNWLKDYVDIDMPVKALADLLTMSGLEVEAIDPIGQDLKGIVAGKILSVQPHPDADRLYVCHVDTGRQEAGCIVLVYDRLHALQTAAARLSALLSDHRDASAAHTDDYKARIHQGLDSIPLHDLQGDG